MIVLVVLGVLVALIVPGLLASRRSSAQAGAAAEVERLAAAVADVVAETGTAPVTSGWQTAPPPRLGYRPPTGYKYAVVNPGAAAGPAARVFVQDTVVPSAAGTRVVDLVGSATGVVCRRDVGAAGSQGTGGWGASTCN